MPIKNLLRTRPRKWAAGIIGGTLIFGAIGNATNPHEPETHAAAAPAVETVPVQQPVVVEAPAPAPASEPAPTMTQQPPSTPPSQPAPAPAPKNTMADSAFIVGLETQVGDLDFFLPYDRADLISMGHEACRALVTVPVLDDAHVRPLAGAMMRAHPGLGIDGALWIHAVAHVEYCPEVQ